MSNELTHILNKQIANWSVLYMKLHNYHWFVKGEQFFTLHTKFEEFYNEGSTYVDDLAERLLAIGGEHVGTMKECLALASVKEATNMESSHEMVKSIVYDFVALIDELKEGMKTAERYNDEITGDMFLVIQSSLEKHVWMLKAFLGRSVE